MASVSATVRPKRSKSSAVNPVGYGLTAGLGTPAAAASGQAAKIVMVTQPAGALSGVAFTTQPAVRLQTASGSNVAEAGITVTAYLVSGSGILGGGKTAVTNASGIATFSNLQLTGSGAHTLGFHALMSEVQSVFSDDVETNKTSSYFEVNTDGGVFGRASVDGTMQWRSQYSTGGTQSWGDLKLGIGRMPAGGGFTSVGPSTVDFGLVTMECDMYHSTNSLTDDQDKFARMTVFSAGDWSQAAIAHWWSNGTTHMEMDPASLTDANGNVLSSGYNDFANMTFLGLTACNTIVFGGVSNPATTKRRYRCVWRLNDPGQSNGYQRMYLNGVLDGEVTGLNFVSTYTDYGINAVMWENYRTGGSGKNHNRMFDNLTVTGQARSVVTAESLSVTLGASAALTGTTTSAWYESEVVTGGDVLIIDLTNEAFVAAGASFDAQRQNILDGIVASSSPALGWNALRSTIPVTAVTRTANTQATITLPALPTYSVSASETLTVTVPGTVLVAGQPLVAGTTLSILEGAPPTGGNPNEPAGMTVGFDEAWLTKPPTASSGAGWYIQQNAARVSVITDPTSPMSDHSCLQLYFPSGAPGGVETMWVTYNESPGWSTTNNTGTLYLRMQVKMSSNWSDGGNNGTKFIWPRPRVENTAHFSPISRALGGMTVGFNFQGSYLGGADDDNEDPTPRTLGVWHDVEWLLYQGTTAAANNGTIKIWVDGTLVVNEVNKKFANDGDALGWKYMDIAPTFGFGTNPVPHDQYIWIDHFYASYK